MYFGTPTMCCKAKDLVASRRFYEALGMEVVEDVPNVRVVLRLGPFRLGLFTFLEESSLNLRGGDVSALHVALRTGGQSLEGTPERYSAGEHGSAVAGECWFTRDPAGNEILFDTHATEQGEEARRRQMAQLLRDTERELVRLGADAACLGSFRREILAKYAPSA
jgi:catechol 2,3-dioxygenase-like lactoylglutathione lyase family enzyme